MWSLTLACEIREDQWLSLLEAYVVNKETVRGRRLNLLTSPMSSERCVKHILFGGA